MRRVWTNLVANAVAGVLVGFGGAVVCYFLILDQYWFNLAPRLPNPDVGLIFPPDEQGDYRYFSAFQATAQGLPFMLSSPLTFVRAFVLLRNDLSGRRWGFLFSCKSDEDDPGHLLKRSAVLGALAASFALTYLGAPVLHWLVNGGYIWNVGQRPRMRNLCNQTHSAALPCEAPEAKNKPTRLSRSSADQIGVMGIHARHPDKPVAHSSW